MPNQIGVIKDELGPQESFDFMGDDGSSREQTRSELGTATRLLEDQYALWHYMDAYQDYNSVKRRIVKPSTKCFVSGKARQERTGANVLSPEPPTTTNRQTVSGVFVFGYTTKEMPKTETSPLTQHE